MDPKVTVLMGVFNRESYLEETIQSVLGQSLGDFEFIIVDDASTDHSWEVLQQQAARDRRIRLMRNEANQGAAPTYNRILAEARGRYIATQDSDDISLPQRLEKQAAVLEARPEVTVVGGFASLMDSQGRPLPRTLLQPTTDKVIRAQALLFNSFIGATMMGRRQTMADHGLQYRYSTVEDFYMSSALLRYGQGVNLDEILIKVRIHGGSVSNFWEKQESLADQVSLENFALRGLDHRFGQEDVLLMRRVGLRGLALSAEERRRQLDLLADFLDCMRTELGLSRAEVHELSHWILVRVLRGMSLPPHHWGNLPELLRLLRLDPRTTLGYLGRKLIPGDGFN
ncbi:MAG: glycosyltransferase [Thermodesulfobacteriota bacterium]